MYHSRSEAIFTVTHSGLQNQDMCGRHWAIGILRMGLDVWAGYVTWDFRKSHCFEGKKEQFCTIQITSWINCKHLCTRFRDYPSWVTSFSKRVLAVVHTLREGPHGVNTHTAYRLTAPILITDLNILQFLFRDILVILHWTGLIHG